jgi:MFS family permease
MFFLNHAPVLPLIMSDLGVSPAQAGLLSTAAFLGGGLAAVPMGALVDRLGPKRVMALSFLVCLAATLAMAVAPSYATLLSSASAAPSSCCPLSPSAWDGAAPSPSAPCPSRSRW